MSSRRAGLSMLAAAAMLLAAAPASAGPADTPADTLGPQQGSSVATVTVNNFNILDVEIYAVTEEGLRFPLGTVNRSSKRNLALPDKILDGTTEFRLKIYSIQPEYRPSAYVRYAGAVKTAVLYGTAETSISLVVGDPLTDSYVNYVH